MRRHSRLLAVMAAIALWGSATDLAVAAEAAKAEHSGGRIGVLIDRPSNQLGPEARAALAFARQVWKAELVHIAGPGRLETADKTPAQLSTYPVIWYHQGDTSSLPVGVENPATLETLRDYVEQGGGLFLSGAALQLIHLMGIEPARPRVGGPGRDSYQAAIVPQVADHPIFAGLATQKSAPLPEMAARSIYLTSGGHPAFSDFHGSRGPQAGMLLARAACAQENPLVEYELGRGRIIVMGWRLANYGLEQNAYRTNLERLTRNLVGYLADRRVWQPVVVQSGPETRRPKAPSPALPTIGDEELTALRLAIEDLIESFGERYPGGPAYLKRLNELTEQRRALLENEGQPQNAAGRGPAGQADPVKTAELAEQFRRLRREALLANPLLDFACLLIVERSQQNLALPANWQSNCSLAPRGYDNRLAVLSLDDLDAEPATLFSPEDGRYVGQVDLHFDGRRMLFSMPGSHGRFQVFEMAVDGTDLRELPLIREPDVDNYDACYLPDGGVVFTSTAPFVGVPCVYGKSHVTNLYRLDPDGRIRQLTVDQDHNWDPVVLNNGRLMYLRWEYTDLPHAHSRILFSMNPDGTAQMAYYGSNSYFPNSFFDARPIPGHPTMVVGVVSGHHGVRRSGRLLLVDPARGRREAEGVVQEIPGRGQTVEAVIRDRLVDGVWPQFLHPFPLSEKYFLVSARPAPGRPWGIYLVDVFDNMVLLKEKAGYALFEPVPLRARPTPPVVADRTEPGRKDALVYLVDIYSGPGLKGIPRGTVKRLRLVGYQFSYRGMGGLLGSVGMDGPWDCKRVLGTVPVKPDGSALFHVPAYTPIAVQPLDEQGQALQLMRSWFTAMPGEVLSCTGCHEHGNTSALSRSTLAGREPPAEIEPWYGPVRGFSFEREVQPVLDRHCVRCHNGASPEAGGAPPDLRGGEIISDWTSAISGHVNPKVGGRFSRAYVELHRFVRRPGIESDLHLLAPMDYHAAGTELVQLLRKGHHGVALDREAWDRLITWIDLNAPYHGRWSEIVGPEKVAALNKRALAMRRRYTGMDDDPELLPQLGAHTVRAGRVRATATGLQTVVAGDAQAGTGAANRQAVTPRAEVSAAGAPKLAGWPFDPAEARRRQQSAAPWRKTVQLGPGVEMQIVRIPAGRFVMGDRDGADDECPAAVVEIEQSFWMAATEVTNEQYALFDPEHDSHVESLHGYQFGVHGYPLNTPRQPVVRVSWQEAMAFCRWLSKRTSIHFTLPTEAQWEYAARAGTSGPFWFGGLDDDFSAFANLGDRQLRSFAIDTYVRVRLVDKPNPYDDWVPKDDRWDDGAFISAEVGRFRPNAWGLHDMHGNVAEWTLSLYRPYPYDAADGRNRLEATGRRVVRGGSWYDRPKRCTSAYRLPYAPFARTFNVGFRVVAIERASEPKAAP